MRSPYAQLQGHKATAAALPMRFDIGHLLFYTLITLAIAVVMTSTAGRDPWKRSIVGSFALCLYIYSGIGLSELSLSGTGFVISYTTYALLFSIAFIILSRVRFDTSVAIKKPRLNSIFSFGRVRRAIIIFYLTSLLIPLLTPQFRLGDLISPPALDFVNVFSEIGDSDSDVFARMSRYLTTLLFAPFLIAIAGTKKKHILAAFIFALCIYIEYVSSRYISRSSILQYLLFYFVYLIFQYPDRRPRIIGLMLTAFLLAGVGAAWFVEFRLGALDSTTLVDMLRNMLEIEINFPRDAGLPLLQSGAEGNMWEYIVWMATLPVPKAIFGQFIDLKINENIAIILTGFAPGELGFFVPLPGALFSSLYSLGTVFWLEPIMIGALAGIAYRTVHEYDNSYLLKCYILLSCSYTLNRAGVAGSAFQLYNSFFWLLLLWSPTYSILSSIGRVSRQKPRKVQVMS